MSNFTLDDIRAAVEAEYASMNIPLEGGVLKLQNPLRLTAAQRAAMKEAQASLSEFSKRRQAEAKAYEEAVAAAEEAGEPAPEAPEVSDGEQFELLANIVRTVANDAGLVEDFLSALGEDVASIATVMSLYRKTVSAGEA